MKRIGLISDTHGYLDDAVFKHFDTCDEIWHAGDFGSMAVAENLASFKPLRGVYGNIDCNAIRAKYPEILHFTCEDIRVCMLHIGGYPNKYSALAKQEIKQQKPSLFISGHSHILKIMYDHSHSCLHMNPGAAGKQGWHKIRTLIRFVINANDISQCEVIELGLR